MVINQPFSIGDILFLEPMYQHFWNKNGEKPIVPVRDHLMWIAEYIDSARFVPESKFKLDYESIETSNPDYFPAKFANQIYRGYAPHDHHDFENMMLDKYRLAGLDPMLWKKIKINFDYSKGLQLAKQLKINVLDDNYILVNENSQAGKTSIPTNTKFRIVEMCEVPGYTVLDWYYIMMYASEIHHVSTCTFYIMQTMMNRDWMQTGIFLYPRPNEDGLRGVSQLNPDFIYTSKN